MLGLFPLGTACSDGGGAQSTELGSVRQAVETKEGTSLEGRFEVMVHDDLDGQVDEQPVLLFDDRSWVELDFADAFPRDLLHRQVSVTGSLEDGRFSVFDLGPMPTDRVDRDPIAFDIIQTDQKIAVLLIGLSGGSSPYDANEMKAAVFGTGRSTTEFYQEGSRGVVKLVGVDDPAGDVFSVSVSASGCSPDYNTVGNEARQVAQSQGAPISSYDKIVYYFPPNGSGCPGGGVGGGDSAFIFGVGINAAWDYIAHEVGHTFGLPHAGSFTNCTSGDSPVVYGGSCTHDEYGDLTDIMGGRNFMFSSFHLETLGWLPPENVLVLEESARVVLAPITVASSTIQSLRIPRGGQGDTAAYHVEFRQPIGFDEGLEQGLTDGVLIRQTVSDPLRPQTTHILDMTPGSTNNDMIDAALAQGRSYQDDNLRIDVVEVTSETATIDVTLDAVPPDPDNPVGVGGTNGSGGGAGDDTATTGASSTTGAGGATSGVGGATTTSAATTTGAATTGAGTTGTTGAVGGAASTGSSTMGSGGAGTVSTTTVGSTTSSVGVGGSTPTTTTSGGVTPTVTSAPPASVDEPGCGCRLGPTPMRRLPAAAGVLLLGMLAWRRSEPRRRQVGRAS